MESPKSARRGAGWVSREACRRYGGATEVGEEIVGEVIAGAAGSRGGDGGKEEHKVGSPSWERAGERQVAGLDVSVEMEQWRGGDYLGSWKVLQLNILRPDDVDWEGIAVGGKTCYFRKKNTIVQSNYISWAVRRYLYVYVFPPGHRLVIYPVNPLPTKHSDSVQSDLKSDQRLRVAGPIRSRLSRVRRDTSFMGVVGPNMRLGWWIFCLAKPIHSSLPRVGEVERYVLRVCR